MGHPQTPKRDGARESRRLASFVALAERASRPLPHELWWCATGQQVPPLAVAFAPDFGRNDKVCEGEGCCGMKRLREKLVGHGKNSRQALKRGHLFYALTARLKSCPSQNTLETEFFRHF